MCRTSGSLAHRGRWLQVAGMATCHLLRYRRASRVAVQPVVPRRESERPEPGSPHSPELHPHSGGATLHGCNLRTLSADREAFARKALTTALREFRVAAKAFNTRSPHAKITVKQEGRDSFTATGEANGEHRVSARIRMEKPSWGSSWTLHYETVHFGFSFDGTPHYQSEVQVRTSDDNYTPIYVGSYGTFPSGNGRTQLPIDVARLFWERLIHPLEVRRR
jgi:hypothetical protein